jgi:hypothetical protein
MEGGGLDAHGEADGDDGGIVDTSRRSAHLIE